MFKSKQAIFLSDCGDHSIPFSNRVLTTPVPPLAPSHQNHHSLSFNSFPPCAPVSPDLSQAVNQVSANFTLEQCFERQELSNKSLSAENQHEKKETASQSFPVSFANSKVQVLCDNSEKPLFCNSNSKVLYSSNDESLQKATMQQRCQENHLNTSQKEVGKQINFSRNNE